MWVEGKECRSLHLDILSRKDLWSYYQSMGLEFRYALGKVLGTQDHPTLRSEGTRLNSSHLARSRMPSSA